MASPTRAEIESQLGKAVGYLQKIQKTASIDADSLIIRHDDIIDTLETNFPAEVTASLSGERAGVDALLTNGPALMEPMIREYGMYIGSPKTDVNDIITDIYDYMADNSLSVKSRGFTFGTPVASGSNVGNAILSRLNKDAKNFDIENCFAEKKRFICSRDRTLGAAIYEEEFDALGEDSERDTLKIDGSGSRSTIRCLSARDSYLSNTSFESIEGSDGAPTAVSYWTPSPAIGSFQGDPINYYRGWSGATTPKAVKFMTDGYLEQKLSVRGAAMDKTIPMYCQVAYNKDVGVVSGGTLTLTLGSKTASVGLASGSGWQILRLAPDDGRWYENFDNGDPAVRITLSGMTGGYLLVDDVILAPFFRFAGNYVIMVSGATPNRLGDEYQYTDTCAETGVLQYWFYRARGRYLPHAGSPTWTDPT